MKRKFLIFTILLCACTSLCVFAQGYNWYFKPEKDGKRPVLVPEADFVDRYDVITMGKEDEKKIYLTFDAGYENGNVEKILDVLKEENVKGAFFVLPQIVKNNTAIVKRMHDEGHLVCNHTYSHRNMSKVSDFETFSKELTDAETVVKEYAGFEMDKYYRPPEGAFCEKNLEYAQKLGYTTVFWSLAYADWDNNKQMHPQKALDLLMSRTHPGCVVLLHPNSDTNAKILGEYIKKMKEQGYEFCSISELKNKTNEE